METATLTSQGRITVPKVVRQQLGLGQGTRLTFVVEGDHAVMRPAMPRRVAPKSGFGMVRVSGPAVPPDFDVVNRLIPKAPR